MNAYTFSFKLEAAATFTANTEEEARKLLHETLGDSATITFSLRGSLMGGEASLIPGTDVVAETEEDV